MVLPLKQRVSSLFLWMRCVCLHQSINPSVACYAHCLPRPLHGTLHAVPFTLLSVPADPQPYLYLCSPLLPGLVVLLWLLVLKCAVLVLTLSPHGKEQWRTIVLLSSWADPLQLDFTKASLLLWFPLVFFFLLCFCGSLRTCLSYFEKKVQCHLWRSKTVNVFYQVIFRKKF